MKAIIRKTWEIIEAFGKPSGKEDEYILVNKADESKTYKDTEVITKDRIRHKFVGYAAKDRDGVISLFSDKPTKDCFRGIWRKATRIGTISSEQAKFDNGYILSWENAEPVKCEIEVVLTTDIYTPHKR